MTKDISVYELAMDLTALLYLGGERRIFPDYGGLLDKALSRTLETLPENLKSNLTFTETTIGFRCDQLPIILHSAVEIGLADWKGFAMNTFLIKLTEQDARMNAVRAGHSTKEFTELGRELIEALTSLEAETAQ